MEEFVLSNLTTYAYLGMFIMLLACGFGVPIPEDIILFTSGYLCYLGIMNLEVSIAVAMAGVLIGDSVIFFAGRHFGAGIREGRPPGFLKNILTKERVEKIHGWFKRFGNAIIFFGRFAAGMRAPTFAVAGSTGMGYPRFVFWDGLAALISVPLFIWLAFHFGSTIEELKHYIARSKLALAGVVIAVILFFVVRYFIKRRKTVKSA